MVKKVLIFVFLCSLNFSWAQQKKETIVIKTKTYCDHCKICETCGQKMETDLYYVKGIKYVNYNEEDMTITIKYQTKKTNPDRIRLEISKLGFDADNIPADPKAYELLDGCCKKRG